MTLLLLALLGAGAQVTAANLPPAAHAWPLEGAPHALAQVEQKALLEQAKALPPVERVRALHDWVVMHLRYDTGGAQTGKAVLSRGTATCEGYATLFDELVRASGLEGRVVRGLLAVPGGAPQPHAWNAVRFDGAWRLVDVTLDDPVLRGDAVGDVGYRTDYLLVPPDIAAIDHWPFDPVWQLGARRPGREAFLSARPTSNAVLLRTGVEVLSATVTPSARVEAKNPRRLHLVLAVDGVRCGAPDDAEVVTLACDKPGARVEVLANDAATGLFLSVVELHDDVAGSR
jgi:hypothetical protein